MKRRSFALAAIGVICLAPTIWAQPPSVRPLFNYNQRGTLTALEVIEFYDLHEQLGATQANRAFQDQLVWWWAVEERFDIDAATEQLIAAYRQSHGDVPTAFRERLSQSLAALPAPGAGVYFPPPDVVRGPLTRLPLPFTLGRPGLGATEKSAISLLSNGVRIPRP